jgi:DNA-binding Lrp family transcriptional regulator
MMHLKKLKALDYEVLSELMKNSKTSDRSLAKKLGVSQPTITRRRGTLEKEGYLKYTGIPDFKKVGLKLMAFNFLSWTSEGETASVTRAKDFIEKVSSFLRRYPNVIFAATGKGLGMGRVSISLHKDYADYVNFIRSLQHEWGQYLDKHDVFLVSLESDHVIRQLSLACLGEYIGGSKGGE